MQRLMVNGAKTGFEPYRPTARSRSAAQVHVLVIQEKRFVQAAQFLETIAAYEQATAGYPWNGAAPQAGGRGVFSPVAPDGQTRQGAGKGWKVPRGFLPRAVAVEQ